MLFVMAAIRKLTIMKTIITDMGIILIFILMVPLILISVLINLFDPSFYKKLFKAIKLHSHISSNNARN